MRARVLCLLVLALCMTCSAYATMPVTVNAVCVPVKGWMPDGWGTCKFIIKNNGSTPVKLVKWSAHWEAGGKVVGDPWGDPIDVDLAPGKDVTRNENSYLPPEAVEKSKPGNAVVVGTFTVRTSTGDEEVPYKVEIPAATLPEKLKTVKGDHIGIALMESRFKNFSGQKNILRWMDESCGAMKELTGYRPFDGKMQIIQECPAHPWWAYAGNPVVCNTDYVGTTIDEINEGYIPFGWVHEVGHNFDVLGEWYIWSGPAAEWQANWKLVYAYETIPDRTFKVKWGRNPSAAYQPAGPTLITDGYHFVDAFFLFFGDTYLSDPTRKWDTLSSDEMHSFFQRIQRVYGWEPYKKWYRAYSRFEALGYKKPETSEAKIQLIAAILSQETGADLIPAFQRWRFPVTEQDVEAMNKAYPVNYREQIKGDVTTAPIKCTTTNNPIFKGWATSNKPISCEFKGKPETEYQVFVGFAEDKRTKPGMRLVDVEVGDKVQGTVDTFKGAKDAPHGYIYRGITDKDGILRVTVKPNAQSQDKTAAVCGFILFPGDAKLDAAGVVKWSGVDPLLIIDAMGYDPKDLGAYYQKTEYKPEALPVMAEVRSKLPSPIFDENPDFIDLYWKAWDTAFQSFRQPGKDSCLVSNYPATSTNGILNLGDTAFMAMLCNYSHPYAPGIQALENFYRVQFKTGGIVESIVESSGLPAPGSSFDSAECLKQPIAAWAEHESYRFTGDKRHLRAVYESLAKYYDACQKLKDSETGLFSKNLTVNTEMLQFASDMAYIAKELGKQPEADSYDADAKVLQAKLGDGTSITATDTVMCVYKHDRSTAISQLQQCVNTFEKSGEVIGACTPVTFLIEDAIGVHVDAPSNMIIWNIQSPKRVGVERLWFGGKTVSLVCDEPEASGKRKLKAESDSAVKLQVIYSGKTIDLDVTPGTASEVML